MTFVVAAVDGSEPSVQAVDWAVDEAARQGVPLHMVCASVWDRYEPDDTDNEDLARTHRAIRQMLADLVTRASARRPGVEITTEVIPDEAVPALLEASRGAAMLVMGSRGRGGFEGLALGSVSLRVAARADVPVVIIRGDGGTPGRTHGRVVLGLGGHQPPGPAGDFALAQAIARNSDLDVVHAWQPDLDLSGLSVVVDTGRAEKRAETLLAAGVTALEQPDSQVNVHPRVVSGNSASALLKAAEDADLLVVGARRRHGQLGPVTHAVLHHAPCPVAVVPNP